MTLTPKEREALLWVRNCLDPDHPEQMPPWMKFDMDNWISPSPCGTACCIGGSMDIYLAGLATPEQPDRITQALDDRPWNDQMGPRSRTPGNLSLYRLFFNYQTFPTPQKAIAAIDAYLSGSKDPWGYYER